MPENLMRFIGFVRHWLEVAWPFWLPWIVLLPAPFVAAIYQRIWDEQFRRKHQRKLGKSTRPTAAEVSDWHSLYQRRYLVWVGIFLGKALLYVALMLSVAAAVMLLVWIVKAGEHSITSWVIGCSLLGMVICLAQAAYHTLRDRLDTWELCRTMALGREDVTQMLGFQVSMQEATQIAESYVRESPDTRIDRLPSIICWPSFTLIFIAGLLHIFAIVDVVWFLRHWGILGILTVYAVVSLYTFTRICDDKQIAVRIDELTKNPHRSIEEDEELDSLWRVSENGLHFWEMLGGFPGSLVAQHLVWHKVRSFSYQYVFWSIVVFHAFAWVVLAATIDRIPSPTQW